MNQIGEKPNKTIVELTDADAQLFIEFQKNYNTFSTLLQSGMFGIRNGNATVNFDKDGVIREINFHVVGYKKGFPIIAIISPL